VIDLQLDLRRGVVGFAALAVLAPSVVLAEGGELPDASIPPPLGAVPILELPFTDTGNTCDNLDDFDVACPHTESTSPDVFYALTPQPGNESFVITLCESAYDTKTYVLDSGLFTVACNDDACSDSQGNPFRSELYEVLLTPGLQYYIGVDGWGGDCGHYELLVDRYEEPCCCLIECDPEDTFEDEPCRFGSGGLDDTNGGCGSEPPVYSPISCGETYCSTSYFDGSFRDTDWYEIECPEAVELQWLGLAEFPMVMGVVDTGFVPDCNLAMGLDPFAICDACKPCIVDPVVCPAGGTAWLWVGHDFTEITDCNDERYTYFVVLECAAPPCPEDVDGDQVVGFGDLSQLLATWGPYDPCP